MPSCRTRISELPMHGEVVPQLRGETAGAPSLCRKGVIEHGMNRAEERLPILL